MEDKTLNINVPKNELGAISNIKANFPSLAERSVVGVFVASNYKANKKYLKTFLEGMLAGFFVAIGYYVALYGASKFADAGVQTVLIGAMFPVAILLITFVGGSLFTTNCLGFTNACVKDVKFNKFFKNLAICYGGNIVGSLVVFLILLAMGVLVPYLKDSNGNNAYTDHGAFTQLAADFTLKKIGELGSALRTGESISAGLVIGTFFSNFFSGIICNVFVCVTLYITFSTKNIAAVVIMLWLTIFVFVISGTPHCIANLILFFCNISQSLVVSSGMDSANILAQSGQTFLPVETPYLFLGVNIIPSILGNFIGGGILIPGIVYLIYKDKIQKISKELSSESIADSAKELVSKLHSSIAL
ncbi:formate/nitrite transporter family protein [Malacoplasma penetrans]|uniref:formate/nitrite transporter family protein n=1 Tax=Malacoplasma penetrans TaxID=28227 RepID=UPI00101212A8|nr:formate/nitrite transporter family protein [Malacoplasma penetrans]RXY96096.1 formate/nitrite transporter family protein [Malacoplasma penetrans]